MDSKPKILAFAASLRKDSYNKKLIKIAVRGAEKTGAEVTLIDLKDYPLPVYDGDDEDTTGIPENAMKLKELFLNHQGLLISCPEYNTSISGAFKNMIDWVSRKIEGQPELICFKDKIVCLMYATTSYHGVVRGLSAAKSVLANIKTIVLPVTASVSHAEKAFDENNELIDQKKSATIENLGKNLAEFLKRLQ
jgi:chromate reductase, NAD(P)H dehydrogenase (quinone)